MPVVDEGYPMDPSPGGHVALIAHMQFWHSSWLQWLQLLLMTSMDPHLQQ